MKGASGEDLSGDDAATVVGVLLAAGAGTRFGMPKILAEQGEWLRLCVSALMAGGCRRVFVTVGAATTAMPQGAEAVQVPTWREGLSESVRAGLVRARGCEGVVGVVLHVVDIPDVSATQVERLLAAAGPAPQALARATHFGQIGHPAYIGTDHLGAVLDSLAGDRGAGPYLAGRDDVIDVECGDLGTGIDHDFPAPRL
ncbi:nucleotidyltransferase family protein [Gordonia rubripertincta]|uniref:NTP transferase domain-containing protein n=1 Tax=Gordonia rubripertincta TaxID=36822 RepID=A0ABT4N1C3_GORRU|nr:NTP transferase domain-containing protein [Gordonia rubripertincta]MCZ4552864.1 NTP transferase domain-containing protein [Gordonia rubripertincta]